LRFGELERLAISFDRAKETRVITLVTSRTFLLDLNEQCVAVAIKRDVFNRLRIPTLLTFHPVFLARATPEMRLAGLDCVVERCAIHPRHHHDATGLLLLDDRGDQSVRIKLQLVIKAHNVQSLHTKRALD
jgi:hypothetical protein